MSWAENLIPQAPTQWRAESEVQRAGHAMSVLLFSSFAEINCFCVVTTFTVREFPLFFPVSKSCYQSSSVSLCTLIYSPCTSHFIASSSEWENFYNLWLLNLVKQESFLTCCGVIIDPIASWEGHSMFNKRWQFYLTVWSLDHQMGVKKSKSWTFSRSHFNLSGFSL